MIRPLSNGVFKRSFVIASVFMLSAIVFFLFYQIAVLSGQKDSLFTKGEEAQTLSTQNYPAMGQK
jgi:hypothetical protein